ncbi:MFS-type transporter [Mycobacteroides abscessus]|nr:MFS-type transporter [Mycobacteroides abscessus]CPZ23230.1 MFS-type transporter [Mycobacteroides abscessus]
MQDSLFWVTFTGAMAVGAAFVTHAHWLAFSGAMIYLTGLIVHMTRTLWPSALDTGSLPTQPNAGSLPTQPNPEGQARDLDR